MSKSFIIKYFFITSAIILLFVLPEHVFYNPANTLCLHKKIFGFQCPLCGMTRAAYELVHLNIVSAIGYNAAVVLLPVYLIFDFFDFLSIKTWTKLTKNIVLILLGISLLALYIVRFIKHT